jgi:PHP-associated
VTRGRRVAIVAFVLGIAVATLRDSVPARPPIQVGGYQVLSGDFHVHAFVGDGGLAPWMLQRHAARVGLDVIAITNHNQTLAGRIGRWAARQSGGPMVLVGEEITGRDFHLIAVGIERAVDWNQPATVAIDQVHAQGGVAIAAHPMHGFAEGYDERALAQLDGLEATNPGLVHSLREMQVEEFYQRTLERNPAVAVIGSSDFHTAASMGGCRTYLLVRERSEAAVIDAIRDGRTVGRCATDRRRGRREQLRGRPELVALVEPYREALAPSPEDLLSKMTTFAVWLSLVAFALLGPRS